MQDDINLMADAERGTTDASVKTVRSLVVKQIQLEDEIKEMERVLAAKKLELRELSHSTLPLLFGQAGLTSLGVNNYEVTIEPYIKASIPRGEGDAAKRVAIFDWLEKNRHGGVVKCYLEASFSKGDMNLARSWAERMQKDDNIP